uniref:Transmembrane protein n=1 Tax=Trichogramma kaykai TaxID=54128 RepID=A0ABD2WV20_9HYME
MGFRRNCTFHRRRWPSSVAFGRRSRPRRRCHRPSRRVDLPTRSLKKKKSPCTYFLCFFIKYISAFLTVIVVIDFRPLSSLVVTDFRTLSFLVVSNFRLSFLLVVIDFWLLLAVGSIGDRNHQYQYQR